MFRIRNAYLIKSFYCTCERVNSIDLEKTVRLINAVHVRTSSKNSLLKNSKYLAKKLAKAQYTS